MAIWIFDQSGGLTLDYDSLGFIAEPNDLLSAASAPDPRWSLHSNQSAAETVQRYTLGVDPSFVEPGEDHVLAWSGASNAYVPKNLSLTLDESTAANVENTASDTRATLNKVFVQTLSPFAYGAVGDDTADDTTALADVIAAGVAAVFTTIDLRGRTYKTTDTLTVGDGVKLCNGTIHCVGVGKKALHVTGDAVTLRDLDVTGRHATATAATDEYGIAAIGVSAADPVRNLHIQNVNTSLFGMYGIYLKHVDGFLVRDCGASDLGYAGIFGASALNGRVVDNDIDNVLAGFSGNGYGIAFTREESDSLVTDPRSTNIAITGNYVNGVPWEGIDTHGGQNITITGNDVYGCTVGIAVVGSDNAANVTTWAPLDVKVHGNTIDSLVTDGSRGFGISFVGAAGTVGASTAHATGSIVGNVIRGHGDQSSAIGGAIRARDTSGLVITGNTFVEPSPHGVVLDNDNYGVAVSGNTTVDQWSNAVTTPSVILIPSGYVTGAVTGNVHRDAGGKAAATYKNVRGYNNSDTTGVNVEAASNVFDDCATPVNGLTATGSKFRFKATFEQPVLAAAGTQGAPSLSFSGDTDTGLYSSSADQLAVSVGGTLRARFLTSGILFSAGYNISTDTTTGMQLATGSTQKLGFYGATPVVRPAALTAADASAVNSGDATTDAVIGNLRTRVNELETNLKALGLLS